MIALLGAIASIVVLWVLATPPSAGPDEPSHVVRAAALVRGQLDGAPVDGSLVAFDLPAHIAFPDPGCFAFLEDVPASCATSIDRPNGSRPLLTAATHYPVWGHLVAGIGSFLPAEFAGPGTRMIDAIIPLGLLGLALIAAARRGWLVAGAVLLCATPPVWFIIAVVNPSHYVITGGIAVWIALSGFRRRTTGQVVGSPLTRLDSLLLGAGWAAMVLPRRDGLLYASLVLALAILIFGIPTRDVAELPRWVRATMALATLATLGWAADSSSDSSPLLFASVLLPFVAVGTRRLWRRFARPRQRGALVAGLTAAAGVVSFAVMARRASGFDATVLQAVIGQTGIDLNEAVGVVGWLDTAVPRTMVMIWLLALGLLAAAAVVGQRRAQLVGAGAVLAVAIVVSWVLTMNQNDADGTYWQGRYYLPLLVGIPIVLATSPVPARIGRLLGRHVGAVALIVLTAALANAMRRWAVGARGTMYPWRWDTYDTALPPIVLLVAHLAAVAVLWSAVDRLAPAVATDSDDWGGGVAAGNPVRRAEGVNLLGYHRAGSGLGEAVRAIDAALTAAGVEISRFDVSLTDSPSVEAGHLCADEVVPGDNSVPGDMVRRTTIAVVTAPELPAALAARPELRDVERVVGYWFWEVATVPEHHRGGMALVDEIWTPTTFVADAYRAMDGAPPVEVRPLPLIEPLVDPAVVQRWRRRLAPHDEFVFLVTLDLFSVVERKNPFAAIDAFAVAELGATARLVIKTINGDQRQGSLGRIEACIAASSAREQIELIDGFVDRADMIGMIAAADCLVSLHRGEGLGLHLAEAMWLGTPVIASRYSGNLDFMDDTNSILVDVDLVAVTNGEGGYPDGMRWAEADVQQAAAAMRHLVADLDRRSAIAVAARTAMETQPSLVQLGQRLVPIGSIERRLGVGR